MPWVSKARQISFVIQIRLKTIYLNLFKMVSLIILEIMLSDKYYYKFAIDIFEEYICLDFNNLHF